MNKAFLFTVLLSAVYTQGKPHLTDEELKRKFMKTYSSRDKDALKLLKREVLDASGKAVPALISVMKGEEYPDNSRWNATFLLGRVMGKKASPFISKFIQHPNWVLRMAALKTLAALGEKRYVDGYSKALRDPSLLVRRQALDNIVRLELKSVASKVWAMLNDNRNYYNEKQNVGKTSLIAAIVRAAGQLHFGQALGALIKMSQNDAHSDIFSDIEYSLHKITGRDIPEGDIPTKRRYWLRHLKTDF